MQPSPKEPSEHQMQAQVIEEAQYRSGKHPELELLHAIPNGGHRHKATARRLKAEGVKNGIPDLFLPVARDGYHGLYIEMKTTNGKIRRSQRRWQARLRQEGYYCEVCRSAKSAMDLLLRYIELGSDD